MKKLFIILIIAIIAVGCKSTKSVIKQHLKTDLTTHMDSTVSSNVIIHATVDSTKVINTVSNNHISERITRTEFSKPDSTGKQAITAQTVTERITDENLNKAENLTIISENSAEIKQDINTNKNTELKQDIKSDSKTSTTTGIPILWWVYLIGLSAIAFGVFKILTKTNIISFIKTILKIK
jgi:hypothetical protein